ncbi:MAG: peptidase dimerization domain-containing protein, partial [Ktedonobacteraceae bacterium]
YPHGLFSNDQTRINVGKIIGGTARNAIPNKVLIEGELRSYEPLKERQKYKQAIQDAFEQAAGLLGGQVKVSFKTHSNGYEIDTEEPLLRIYRTILEQRGSVLQMRPTFIGSDTSGFRPAVRAFTISTGVVNEHSTEEYVAVDPLEQLVSDTLQMLALWSKR